MNISDVKDEKNLDVFSDDTEFDLVEEHPRYILEPFEIIYPSDSRYENALTREQINKMKQQDNRIEHNDVESNY